MRYHHQFGVLVPFAKKHFRVLVLAIAGIFILSQFTWLMSLVQAGDDDETITITGDTTTVGGGPGWLFNADPTTATPFEFNDTESKIGDGSLEVFPIGSNPADKFIGGLVVQDDLDKFESLKYDFKIGGDGVSSDAVHFYLNIYTWFDDTPDFYDCRFDYVPSDNASTDWRTFEVDFDDDADNVAEKVVSTCPDNPADMPDGSQLFFMAINVGDTSANDEGLGGYLDKVVVKAEKEDSDKTQKTTYDFEPAMEGDCLTTPFFHEDNELQIQSNENRDDDKQETTTCIVVVDCEVVGISASRDLSNVIVKYADGTYDKYDDFDEDQTEWDVPQDPGNYIVGLWIHAGNNHYPDDPDPEEYNDGNSVGRFHEVTPPEGCEVLGDDCKPGPGWADSVLNSQQGTTKGGGAILPARTNPDNALGEPDGVFFSLGVEGSLEVEFNGFVTNEEGDDLSFHEVTNGPYPAEAANVEVSQDGIAWLPAGTVTNNGGVGGVNFIDFDSTGLDWIRFVRVSEASDFNLHNNDADGFDVDAIDATNIVCEEPQEPVEPCFVTVVSDITNTVNEKEGAAAKALTFVHPGWTASIPGATWIWGDDPVVDPTVDETQTFKQSFVWNGPVTDAVMDIATDNRYEIRLNGVLVGASVDDYDGAFDNRRRWLVATLFALND